MMREPEMKSENEVRENIEEALLVFGDFWKADEESQMKAMETAMRCMQVFLQLID